jgi:hypothetical protein
MLPATYRIQKEVEARQRFQRREAERWRLAKAGHEAQEPTVGGLLHAVAHAMRRGSVIKKGEGRQWQPIERASARQP